MEVGGSVCFVTIGHGRAPTEATPSHFLVFVCSRGPVSFVISRALLPAAVWVCPPQIQLSVRIGDHSSVSIAPPPISRSLLE